LLNPDAVEVEVRHEQGSQGGQTMSNMRAAELWLGLVERERQWFTLLVILCQQSSSPPPAKQVAKT